MKPELPPRVKPGDPITAEAFNAVAEALERFLNLEVAPNGYLRMDRGPSGIALWLAVPQGIMAELDGATSPYSWTEVERPDPTMPWASFAGSRTGTTDAYELNAKGGLGGKVVRLRRTSVGDWRFAWVGVACNWTFTVRGCFNVAFSGATVNLRQGGSLIATGTTNGSGQVTFNVPTGTYDVEVPSPGTNYDTYTASVAHTCSQSTTITVPPDTGYVCGASVVCGCIPSPDTILVTGNDPDFAVSDTCIYNSPPGGYPGTPPSNVWFGQSLHIRGPLGGANYYLTVTCAITVSGGTEGYALNFVNATTGGVSRFWDFAAATPGNSCSPFDFPNGTQVGLAFGNSWALSA